jgi:hypothetical protein
MAAGGLTGKAVAGVLVAAALVAAAAAVAVVLARITVPIRDNMAKLDITMAPGLFARPHSATVIVMSAAFVSGRR